MVVACLAKISPLDTATGTRTDIYVSSVNDAVNARLVNGLNSQKWEPAIKDLPVLGIELWNGDFQAAVVPAAAAFNLAMATVKKTWASADAYDWIGAPVIIYAETPGAAWPWTSRFVGRVTNLSRKNQLLSLTAEVDKDPFDKNVLTASYAGTGGAEGGADLKNKLKPLALGYCKNVQPILIDAVNSVYQFSAYGAIEQVTTLYERGAAFSAAVGDYANYAALVAASIPAGKWGTCLAEGLIRLGAPEYGVITADIRGHKVGGSTPRLTGAVISALATLASVSSGGLDSASLTAMDTAVPYNINLVLTEQVTFLEIAKALALACNWQAGLSLTGTFFVAKVTLTGSTVLTLNAKGQASPQVTGSEEASVSVPYWRTVLGADRAWRVHGNDEIAFNTALIDKGLYDPATTYREGNYVKLADGSQWLYLNATPSAGNAPPNLPTTTNTWWESMTPPPVGGGGNLLDPTGDLAQAWFENGASFGTPVSTTGRAFKQFRIELDTAAAIGNWGPAVPCDPDATYFYKYVATADTAMANTINSSYRYYDSSGGYLSAVNLSTITQVSGNDVFGVEYEISTSFKTPANAAFIQLYVERPSISGGGKFFVGEPYLSRFQAGADVTSWIEGIADIEIQADSSGTVPSASLPKLQNFKLIYNDVDVTTSSDWSVTVDSGTIAASVGSATGVLSLNTSGGVLTSSIVTISASYNGTTRSRQVAITRKNAAVSDSGSGSGSSASTTLTYALHAATSFGSLSEILTVQAGSGGFVNLTANVQFIGAAPGDRAHYRWYQDVGGVYTAIGSDVAATTVFGGADEWGAYPGYGSCNYQVTGLTPGASYSFKLYGRNDAADYNAGSHNTYTSTYDQPLSAVGS